MHDKIQSVLTGNVGNILIFVGIVIFFLIGSRLGIDRIGPGGNLRRSGDSDQGLRRCPGPCGAGSRARSGDRKYNNNAVFSDAVNAIAYLVTPVVVRRGYARDVIDSRVLVITLLFGIVIGFLLGCFL